MPEISGIIQEFLEGNIKTLSGPEPVIQSKTITENGTYTVPSGVDGYSPVIVDVPPTQPVIQSKTITENGTYTAPEGVDGYSPVVVNVPATQPVIESKTITENGTYTPESGVDGFAPVVVDVPETPIIIESKTITENGTYTAPSGVDGFSPVVVNVPLPPNAYLLKSVANLPQPIASFNDGADAPMKSLKVAIAPQQEGSGDPSPTNIRPIIGWSAANVTRTGKNLCKSTIHGYVSNSENKVVIDNDSESAIFYAKKGTTYTISSSSNMDKSRLGLVATENVVNNTPCSEVVDLETNIKTWTATWDGWTVWYVCGNRRTTFDTSAQVEIGTTPTTYEPYNGQTYTIDLDGTRYGGTLDVVNGVLTLTHGYIASYNGETLPSTWISDRDVYEEGTTPTIGAEVCYELATPLTIQLTPTLVKSLLGSNNVWADTGDITDAEYFSKNT